MLRERTKLLLLLRDQLKGRLRKVVSVRAEIVFGRGRRGREGLCVGRGRLLIARDSSCCV